jgi:hypothetical protein
LEPPVRQQVEELEVVAQLQYLEEPEVEEVAQQRVAEQFGELQQY